MKSRNIITGLLILGMSNWWGCSSLDNSKRYPAGTMDAGIIGPKGEVILFYKENGEIIVKQCEDYTVLNSRSDCKVKPGTVLQKVSLEDFRSSLKMALRLPGGEYDAETKRKIELYNDGKSDDTARLLAEQAELKSQVAKIEAFIDEYGAENADSSHLQSLKEALKRVTSELGDRAELIQIIGEINGNIDNLVNDIISSDTLYKYTFSKQKTGFVFNILRAYLRAPMISASFQRIAKGSFTMGGPTSEDDRRDDEDEGQKEVTISKSFDIMTTEVTQMQWFLVMGTNPSRFKKPEHCDNHININGEGLCPNNPVENVSWNDVQAYIKKLNSSLGLSGCNGTPSDSKGCYRLPTEAEWEFAARGKTATPYFFGDNPSRLGDYAWYWDNSGEKTHPVGLKRANPYGLYDVYGNVWEWVQDQYNETLKGGTDPLQTTSVSGSYRVFRGGDWYYDSQFLSSPYRLNGSPDLGFFVVGFRLVRQVD